MKIFKWHIISNDEYQKLTWNFEDMQSDWANDQVELETLRNKNEVCAINGFELGKNSAKMVINPVLSDLKKLRDNTWDKELVDKIIGWLKEYMEE